MHNIKEDKMVSKIVRLRQEEDGLHEVYQQIERANQYSSDTNISDKISDLMNHIREEQYSIRSTIEIYESELGLDSVILERGV